jgi:hypothetical protein
MEPDWLRGLGGRLGAWVLARLPSRFRLLFGPEPSHTFQITEKLFMSLLSLCKPDMWAFLSSFQQKPYKNRHSPKLMEFC